MTTTAPGRIDIIIFPNGGKEVIGRLPSYPSVKEALYIGLVNEFVSSKVGTLEIPTKYTGYYSVNNDVASIQWVPYTGGIEQQQPSETEEQSED